MSQFVKLLDGLDVAPLLAQLEAHPELWGADDAWTSAGKGTAIVEAGMAEHNIVLRYNSSPQGHTPHPMHWDRPAMHILTEAEPLLRAVMAAIGCVLLGRVIISRMLPGQEIKPHTHQFRLPFNVPRVFDTHQIPLQVDQGVIFRCGDEDCYMKPGTAWTFDNQTLHSVRNNSNRERLSMMIDMRPFKPLWG